MNTTRRSFLASIPALAALLGFKIASQKPKSQVVHVPIERMNAGCAMRSSTVLIECEEQIVAGQMLTISDNGKAKLHYGQTSPIIGFAISSTRSNGLVEVVFQ